MAKMGADELARVLVRGKEITVELIVERGLLQRSDPDATKEVRGLAGVVNEQLHQEFPKLGVAYQLRPAIASRRNEQPAFWHVKYAMLESGLEIDAMDLILSAEDAA